MIQATIHGSAKILWGYLLLSQPAQSADVLLVLGGGDEREAIYAAELSRRYQYDQMIFSGGIAHQHERFLAKAWTDTEAEHFQKTFLQHGCVRGQMLIETKAQNTSDNAKLSYELLVSSGQKIPRTMQVVTKPYMERRAKATFDVQWPDKTTRIFMTSPSLIFDQYCNDTQPFDKVVNLMVGDLQRIIE